jgi:integrase
MAWKYKRGEVWWIGTRANGRIIAKSTGERDEAKAQAQLSSLETMEAAQKAGRLNRELFEALTGAHLEVLRLFESIDTWLVETTNPNTKRNYTSFAKQFREAMPHNPPLAEITHEQMRSLLAGIRAVKRPSTANFALKCAKAFFGRFKGAVRKDPTEGIPMFKEDAEKVNREAFTPDQIRQLVAVASPFWKCATALAFYSGLRLSNCAMLKVGQLDCRTGKVVVARTVKTGAPVCVRLPAAVVAMIREAIPDDASPDDYVWPDQAKQAERHVGGLSDQFGTVLVNEPARATERQAGETLTHSRSTHCDTRSFPPWPIRERTSKSLRSWSAMLQTASMTFTPISGRTRLTGRSGYSLTLRSRR